MAETTEQPIPEEVKTESRVVTATRKAVKTVIEADESIKEWRNTLSAKDVSVYRAWANAVDNFHARMTDVDKKKLSTRLESIKMRLRGIWEQVTTPVIDFTFRNIGRGMKAAGVAVVASSVFPAIPFTLPLAGAGALLFGGGVLAEKMRPGRIEHKGGLIFRKLPVGIDQDRPLQNKSKHKAEKWFIKKSRAYERKIGRVQGENIKDLVNKRVHKMIVDFAYPEGKPPKTAAQ